MVNSLVDRATSELLKGPDFVKIREISNICMRDAVQAKVAIKGIKKRLQSRSAKVQLLSLILLDTLVKNCGDVVHRNVIEKELLVDMIKIIYKKPDYRVKEKILILIETWQETLGGPIAKRTQFYNAYYQLLHSGVIFPHRPEKTTPKVTPPPQERPVTSPQIVSNADQPKVRDVSPTKNMSPSLSSTEIQDAQCIIRVLEEMLNTIEPKTKEALNKDVIVDLVKLCRAYKQRLSQLPKSTSDELLLQQGLALDDNLHHVLTKHEAIALGIAISVPQVETTKPKSNTEVVKVEAPLVDTEDNKHSDRSASNPNQSPVIAKVQPTSPTKIEPQVDLLSFDEYTSPKLENSLAIVPAGTHPIANSHNDLPLNGLLYQPSDYPNRHVPNMMMSQYDPSLYNPYSNGQITRPTSPAYGNQIIKRSLYPQTQWEFTNNDPYYNPPIQVTQVVINPHSTPNHPGSQVTITQHPTGLYSPQMQMGGHMGNFGYGSGYQQMNGYSRQFENRMANLSMCDDNASVYSSTSSMKSSMIDDDLFGDLVDRNKFKPGKL